jgi:putative ABC transport system permease protein
MDAFFQDLRQGLRMLMTTPAFTTVAVVALALGIGANTAIFSVINAVILRPLAFNEPDRLVHVHRVQPPIQRGSVSRPDFFEWQSHNEVFKQIAGFYYQTFNLTGVDEAERIVGVKASGNFFDLFGVSPEAGRFFQEEDDTSAAAKVVVIGYRLWQRRFGGDPSVVGKTILLNDEVYSVAGVAPSSFNFPQAIEIWTPAALAEDKTTRGNNYLKVIARLKDGVSEAQAETQMNQLCAALAEQFPANDTNLSVHIVSLLQEQNRNIHTALIALLGAVALVLLIACANVANLLLARTAARQREIAVRTALGASRWRIIRQLLTESFLLGVIGGCLGIALASWGIQILVSLAPSGIPRSSEIGVDKWVLGFTFLVSVVTGLVFGLAPALQVSRPDLNETLKEGSRGAATGSPHRALLRRLLISGEVALSLMLLIGAGLLIESISRLTEVNPGFDPHNVLTVRVSLPQKKTAAAAADPNSLYKDSIRQASLFLAEVDRRMRMLPGVQSVGSINDLPITGQSSVNGDFNIEGRPAYPPGEAPVAEFRIVSGDYFSAMGIQLLAGRVFNEHDTLETPIGILINKTLAKRFFADEEPIGKRLLVGDGNPHEIIGVVGDARQWGLDRLPDPEVYFAASQAQLSTEATLVARTSVDPSSLVEAVRRQIREANHDAPVFSVKPMTQVLALSTSQQRFNATLMSTFALVALLMTAIGLYGVISYSAAQRTKEIGIRMALGAGRTNILRLVLREGMYVAFAGITTGLVGAALVTRIISSMLFGVAATDPATYAVVSILLLAVTLGASLVPARRATKVDPIIALRYE